MEDNTLVKSSSAITINIPVDDDVGGDRYQKTMDAVAWSAGSSCYGPSRQTSKE
jgi:hypothetical protein